MGVGGEWRGGVRQRLREFFSRGFHDTHPPSLSLPTLMGISIIIYLLFLFFDSSVCIIYLSFHLTFTWDDVLVITNRQLRHLTLQSHGMSQTSPVYSHSHGMSQTSPIPAKMMLTRTGHPPLQQRTSKSLDSHIHIGCSNHHQHG